LSTYLLGEIPQKGEGFCAGNGPFHLNLFLRKEMDPLPFRKLSNSVDISIGLKKYFLPEFWNGICLTFLNHSFLGETGYP
jgi:hypothetical protein